MSNLVSLSSSVAFTQLPNFHFSLHNLVCNTEHEPDNQDSNYYIDLQPYAFALISNKIRIQINCFC